MPSWSAKIIADTVTPKLAAFAGKIEKEVEMELDVVGADMKDIASSAQQVQAPHLDQRPTRKETRSHPGMVGVNMKMPGPIRRRWDLRPSSLEREAL